MSNLIETSTGQTENVKGRSEHYSNISHLNIIQINLNHSKQGSDLLINYLINKKINIALIQDPYLQKETNYLPSFPDTG
jgi:hypothetical protein